MQIVVLGDIHGNLEALRAALAEAARVGCDGLFHTGDLVGYGPSPNETIDLIRSEGIEGVRGNFDDNAAWGRESPGAARDEDGQSFGDAAYRWTVQRVGYDQRNYLKNLPFSIDRKIGERYLSLFHASPTDLYLPIEEDAKEPRLREMAEVTDADIHVFGHTHRSFHRVVQGRHFVNAGSVGYPVDGDPRACMAIIRLDGGVKVEFRRIPYDVEKTAREIESSGLPLQLARRLRRGGS